MCLLFRNFQHPFNLSIHYLTEEESMLLEIYEQKIQQEKEKQKVEFTLKEFQRNLKNIDDQSDKVISDKTYISKAVYLINIIQQCIDGNTEIFNKLIYLSQSAIQQFLFFVKLCSKIFQYNTHIPHQRKTFLAMCLQFKIGIPISNSFKNLGQSFTFINKESYFRISKNIKLDTSQQYCISFDQETSIISTQKILQQIKLFFNKFLDNYTRRYIKIQEETNSRYLILHYAYTMMKLNNISSLDTQLFKDSKHSFFLELTLSKLIKNRTFQLTPLNDKPKHNEITEIYIAEAMNYFNKAQTSSDKLKIQYYLYIGFQISNIIHCQANSIKFIHKLEENKFISKLVNKDYFNQQINYVNYLQSLNYCYDIEQAHKALNYYNYLFKQKYFSSVIKYQQDLHIISLTIIFTLNYLNNNQEQKNEEINQYTLYLTQSSLQIIKLKLENSSQQNLQQSTPQINEQQQQQQLQSHQQEVGELSQESQSESEFNSDSDSNLKYKQSLQYQKQQELNQQFLKIDMLKQTPEQINKQQIDIGQLIIQFIEFLCNQFTSINDNYEKIFLILLTFLSNLSVIFRQTKILQKSLFIQIQYIIEQNIKCIQNESKSKLLQELLKSFISETYDWLKFQKTEQYQLYSIQISPQYIETKQLEDYLNQNLTQSQDYSYIQKQQVEEHIKSKFANPYMAYRLILTQKMQIHHFPDILLMKGEISQIYLKIDDIRKKLVGLLYSKYIKNSINYRSIIHELVQLAAVEQDADKYVKPHLSYNNGQQQNFRQQKNRYNVYSDLELLEDSIDCWKTKGKDINIMIKKVREQRDINLLKQQNKYRNIYKTFRK